MWLKFFHFIGLTNLSDEQIDKYERFKTINLDIDKNTIPVGRWLYDTDMSNFNVYRTNDGKACFAFYFEVKQDHYKMYFAYFFSDLHEKVYLAMNKGGDLFYTAKNEYPTLSELQAKRLAKKLAEHYWRDYTEYVDRSSQQVPVQWKIWLFRRGG